MKPNPLSKRKRPDIDVDAGEKSSSAVPREDFVIVAIGASAGGLEAFTEL
jgi:chemotaxis response regulator CheB